MDSDFKKKILSKDRKIKELEEAISCLNEEINSLKKANNDNMRSRSSLQSRELMDKENKVREL